MGRAQSLKRIRRAAERLTTGKPYRALLADGQRVRMVQDGVGADGKPKMRQFAYTGTLRDDPKTTRGLYRMMKKGTQREVRRTRHG